MMLETRKSLFNKVTADDAELSIVVDSLNRVWFTDPSFCRIREDLGILRDQDMDIQGAYHLDPDNSLYLVVSDFSQPNGLCLSMEERIFFINDSWQSTIRVFAAESNGSLTGGEVWATGFRRGRRRAREPKGGSRR